MIRHLVRSALLALAVAFLAGCGPKPKLLHVYTWADYINPEVVTEFEAQANCRVVIDSFDSNEAMYAKIKAGAGGYDLIVPSSYMVSIMSKQGMLLPLRHELLPNLKHIDRSFLSMTEDSEMQHSVPYMISVSGIGYNTADVKDFRPSWAMFDRADLRGRMTMLDDMRETVGAALKFLGYSLNTTDEKQLAEAGDVLLRWRANLAKFEVDEAKRGLGAGEFLVIHAYNGDILQLMQENDKVGFAVPEEGTSLASDDMVIPSFSKEIELAHAFINFLNEPGVCARNMEYVSYLAPNREAQAQTSAEFRGNAAIFLSPEFIAKCEVIRDLGADNANYTKIWDAVKGGK